MLACTKVLLVCPQKHQASVVRSLLLITGQRCGSASRRFCAASSHSSSRSPEQNSSSSQAEQLQASVGRQDSCSPAMVAVDITKHNFNEVLPAVKQALERCSFFAVDCEMTGLHTDGFKHEYLDDHQSRCVYVGV